MRLPLVFLTIKRANQERAYCHSAIDLDILLETNHNFILKAAFKSDPHHILLPPHHDDFNVNNPGLYGSKS